MRGLALPALALALLAAAPVAAEQFTCALVAGCGSADCGNDATIAATLESGPDGWRMISNGEIAGSFVEVGQGQGNRHFVSVDIDTEAGAAALLSVFEDGAAFLSLHGTFLSPQAETYQGHCLLETS